MLRRISGKGQGLDMSENVQFTRLLIGGAALLLSIKVFKNPTLRTLGLLTAGVNILFYAKEFEEKGSGF